MRQYRPTIEELKKRYSSEMARKMMIAKRHAANPSLATRNKIPDNSEPWLPHKPTSLAECIWISEQVAAKIDAWKQAAQ